MVEKTVVTPFDSVTIEQLEAALKEYTAGINYYLGREQAASEAYLQATNSATAALLDLNAYFRSRSIVEKEKESIVAELALREKKKQ